MTDPLRRLTPVVRLAPAKLNLTLAVIGRRPDGFHELHSVLTPLELADRLSLMPTSGVADRIHVTGFPAGPDAENLVLRALAALRARVGRPPPPAVAARLEKRIPVAAGLGGGSSDAAAALDAAIEAWGVDLDAGTRLAIAAALGSDVPFFLGAGPALLTGRGETVERLRPTVGAAPGVLLVTPAVAVATADVYRAFAAGARPGTGSARVTSEHLALELRGGLRSTALHDRAGVLAAANDLAPATAAVLPEIVPFRRALIRTLGRPVGQAGSGPTQWVLYPSLEDAADAAAHIRDAHAAGRLPPLGDAPPSVIATRFGADPDLAPHVHEGGPA